MALDHEPPQGRNFWKAIGGLTANVKWLIEAVKRLELRLDDSNERLDRGLKETNDRIDRGQKETNERMDRNFERLDRKIDRVTYAMIAFGSGILAMLIMLYLRSN